MTRTDLVQAYQTGDLQRSRFVRGLVGAGVSLSAALAYAVALAPDAQAQSKSEAEAAAKCEKYGSGSSQCDRAVARYCRERGFDVGQFYDFYGGSGVSCFDFYNSF